MSTKFGWILPYLVWSHTEPNKFVASMSETRYRLDGVESGPSHHAPTIQHNNPIYTNFPYLFICPTHEKSVVRSVSSDDTPLVTSNVFSAPQYSSFCGLRWDVCSEFPSQVQSFQLYSLDFREQEIPTNQPVDPISVQLGDSRLAHLEILQVLKHIRETQFYHRHTWSRSRL